jgi:ribonuclease Z
MSRITFLGTASAVPNQIHQNSHFILETDDRVVLVDCAGNPIVGLEQAGIDPLTITDLILTHFHPDHVSGAPLLLMDLWLMGRDDLLTVHGLQDVIDRFKKMMELYEWRDWKGFYQVNFHGLSAAEFTPVLNDDAVNIQSSMVCHMIPAIGLRFELPEGVIAYSTDTGPCEQVVRLAESADILIHEASGSSHGHSSATEAGVIASKAGVKTLVLTHYPPDVNITDMIAEAGSTFDGDVLAAEDMMQLVIS